MQSPDYEAVEAIVEQSLADVIPAGYRVDKLDRERGWVIVKTVLQPGERANQEYNVWITPDVSLVVITYGNIDAGMGPSFLNSLVVPAVTLLAAGAPGSVSAALHDMLTREPNLWGCS